MGPVYWMAQVENISIITERSVGPRWPRGLTPSGCPAESPGSPPALLPLLSVLLQAANLPLSAGLLVTSQPLCPDHQLPPRHPLHPSLPPSVPSRLPITWPQQPSQLPSLHTGSRRTWSRGRGCVPGLAPATAGPDGLGGPCPGLMVSA